MSNGHGGRRDGAGRKVGSASKRTREIANKAAAEGITPLEVMLQTMRDAWDSEDRKTATEMAIAAAPYIHPRLAATEMKVDGEYRQRVISDKPMSDQQWMALHGSPAST